MSDAAGLAPAGARYRQIAQSLAAAIARGRYPVGARLPTEDELSRRFEASRFTVRQALSSLRGQGVIASRRGVGSVVVATQSQPSYVESFASIEGLKQHARGVPLAVETISDVVAKEPLAAELRCEPGSEFVTVRGWRYPGGIRSGTPLGWSEVFIRAEYGSIRERLRHPKGSFAQEIMETFGVAIARIDQEITAVPVPAALSDMLDADPEGPALQITRWYRRADGIAFEIARSIFPAGRYTHVSQIMPAVRP